MSNESAGAQQTADDTPKPNCFQPVCDYCKKPDAKWLAYELRLGKRSLRPGPGVEYHCMDAFYGAQ